LFFIRNIAGDYDIYIKNTGAAPLINSTIKQLVFFVENEENISACH
jgi:hypothetical protein